MIVAEAVVFEMNSVAGKRNMKCWTRTRCRGVFEVEIENLENSWHPKGRASLFEHFTIDIQQSHLSCIIIYRMFSDRIP